MYLQQGGRYGQGSAVYQAKNPEFGATFYYYAKELPKSLKSERLKKEKELFKNGEQIPIPTKEQLDGKLIPETEVSNTTQNLKSKKQHQVWCSLKVVHLPWVKFRMM